MHPSLKDAWFGVDLNCRCAVYKHSKVTEDKMVNVGDRVNVVGYRGFFEYYDFKGKEGVVIQMNNGSIVIETDSGYKRYGDERDVEVIVATPPKKIQQDGYEYELVGPVKPEWLVDGALVVNVHDGGKRLIEEVNPGVFNLKVNDLVSIRYHEGNRDQYRPHQASDWKWGDWAMYDEKRVFVVCPEQCYGYAMISGEGFPNGLKYVPFSELIPTF